VPAQRAQHGVDRGQTGERGACGHAHIPTRVPSASRTATPSGIRAPAQATSVRRASSPPGPERTAAYRTTAAPVGRTATAVGLAVRSVAPQASTAAPSRA
jgi:hypothetical protein